VEVIEHENNKSVQTKASHPFAGERRSLYLRIGTAVILIVLLLQWIDLGLALKTIATIDGRYLLLILALVFLDQKLLTTLEIPSRGSGWPKFKTSPNLRRVRRK